MTLDEIPPVLFEFLLLKHLANAFRTRNIDKTDRFRLHRRVKPRLRERNETKRPVHAEIGIRRAARQQPHRRHLGKRHGGKGALSLFPGVETRPQAIKFAEGPLVAVAYHLLDARQALRRKRAALAGCGDDATGQHDFGLQERRLVHQAEAVAVVAGHFDGHDIRSLLRRERNLIHAEMALGRPGRPPANMPPVEGDAIVAASGYAQHGTIGFIRLKGGSKAEEGVHFRFAPLGPDGDGLFEARFARGGTRDGAQKNGDAKQDCLAANRRLMVFHGWKCETENVLGSVPRQGHFGQLTPRIFTSLVAWAGTVAT